MVRWLVVVVCLAGCDKLFGLLPIKTVDASSDAVADAVDDTTRDGNDACPQSYNLTFTGATTQYRYVDASSGWLAAELTCFMDTSTRTHLVVLTDDNERAALAGALVMSSVTSSVWLGLSDRQKEDAFLWVTDEPVGMPPRTSPPWIIGQPDNQGVAQHCVRMAGTNAGQDATLFDDSDCTLPLDFVCECDAFAPDPTNF
ncbi:MAG TPA: C-type lectin domain-containing protein [Kofleriaceae bacterium]